MTNKTLHFFLEEDKRYHIDSGHVDLFAVACKKGKIISKHLPLAQFQAGDDFYAFKTVQTTYRLLAVPSQDIQLTSEKLPDDSALKQDHELQKNLSSWIEKLNTHLMRTSSELDLSLSITEKRLQERGAASIRTFYNAFIEGLPYLFANQAALSEQWVDTTLEHIAEAQSMDKKFIDSTTDRHSALEDDDNRHPQNHIFLALEQVCQYHQFDAGKFNGDNISFSSAPEELKYFSEKLQLRVIEDTLRKNWWEKATLPYIAFAKTGQALALIPDKNNCYYTTNNTTGKKEKVTPELAASLQPVVYTVAPTFPSNQASISFKTLLKTAYFRQNKDFLLMLTAFLFVSLLGLIVPILTGRILDYGIGHANVHFVAQATIALALTAASIALFSVIKSMLLIRVEIKSNYRLQSAVMDRILKLPIQFFSQYQSADLMNRVLGVDAIVKSISGVNISSTLSFLFSFFSFIVMFIYEPLLSIIIFLVTLLLLVFFILFIKLQIPYTQKALDDLGKTYGFMNQVILGISRIKVFAKEPFASLVWTKYYTSFRRNLFKSYFFGVIRRAIFKNAQLFSLIFIFLAIGFFKSFDSLQNFIVFNSAFAQFFVGMVDFSQVGGTLIPAIIFYRRLKPILEARVENIFKDNSKLERPKGKISLRNVGFRYQTESPWVLNKVNLEIEPGECVAFVGCSGSGKTTLLRLLLGLFQLSKGTIAFDGVNLDELNVRSLRQQIGVVLQGGSLIRASILNNLIGNTHFTEDDAWYAAKIAGIDDDIRAMPMGMQTIVSDTANTLSGGQKQRILIAKALVKRPKILLLDEATSALDNKAQALVTSNLAKLNVTQIMVAHRLSTVLHADKIVVLEKGQIVESGTYENLIKNEAGLFSRLVNSQTA